MFLYSPVLVSLCLHLLVLSDLLIFSTSAPQPSFTISPMHLCSLLLLCFMLCVPCPFYAPFLFYAFQLLHSASFYTPESLSTTPPISSLFNIFILSVHLLHPLFTMLLHALLMSSALPNHHHNASTSLAVKLMCSSSLSVMPSLSNI
jgi:hypothetical protein